MRLASYAVGRTRSQRAFLRITRAFDAELDDVAKVSMRRPDFFGRSFLGLVHEALRGRGSAWSAGEREFFAAVVSTANTCSFCVGTHGEIARLATGLRLDDDWRDGRWGAKATAVAVFLDALTRDPGSSVDDPLAAARASGVSDEALSEAVYIAFTFNVINRVADALEFTHSSSRARVRGARILRRNGYRLPGFLMPRHTG
jgi:uncharacterized peroxidase-related enzyme